MAAAAQAGLEGGIARLRELIALKEAARTDFNAYCRLFGYEPARHHRYVNDKLQQIAEGKLDRLMIFEPPGSAKSTYASVLFPSWILGIQPGIPIIGSSHSAGLAEHFSWRCRAIVQSPEWKSLMDAEIPEDARSVGYWRTTKGSEYLAIGVEGRVTGRRAGGLIMDDPVSGAEAADSLVQREALWNWYLNEARTRLKPGAFVVLILTRWHLDDIAGRILPKNWNGESGRVETDSGEVWEVVCLPALARANDPLGRAEGEALWPEYITLEMLERERKLRGPRSWSALYQQTPIPDKGGEFKREWLKFYKRGEMAPDRLARMTRVIVADPAHSRKVDSDRTAMFSVGLGDDGNYYVLDIVADRLSLTQKGDALFTMHRTYKPVRTGWERFGMQSDIEHFEDRMAREGYRFHITELRGPQRKEDRIRRLVPIMENRRLYFPEELYKTLADGSYQDMVQLFISEMTRFPSGRHDDMLDGLSRMLDPEMNLKYETVVAPVNTRPIMQREPDGDGLWF